MPENENRIYQPGDVQIKSIVIQSVNGTQLDMTNFFETVFLYEDITTNTMSAEFVFSDSYNIIRHLPIVGREQITITWNTPTLQEREETFYVYGIGNRELINNNQTQTFKLNGISLEGFSNQTQKIRKSFEGRYTEIAKQIFDSFLKIGRKDILVVDPSLGSKKVVVPAMNPFQAINWTLSKASNQARPGECNYLCFENRDGFIVSTFSTLSALEVSEAYTFYPPNQTRPDGLSDIRSELRNVRQYNIMPNFDRMREVSQGCYGSTLCTFDPVSAQYTEHTFDYLEEFPNHRHASPSPLLAPSDNALTQNSLANIPHHTSHSFAFDGIDDVEEPGLWRQKRMSQMKLMDSQRIVLEVPGDSRRTVGETIAFEVISPETRPNKQNYYDEYLSGKYVVAAVQHRIVRGNYMCVLEIVRDSLDKQIPDQKEQIGFNS